MGAKPVVALIRLSLGTVALEKVHEETATSTATASLRPVAALGSNLASALEVGGDDLDRPAGATARARSTQGVRRVRSVRRKQRVLQVDRVECAQPYDAAAGSAETRSRQA